MSGCAGPRAWGTGEPGKENEHDMIILYNPRAAESKHRMPISILSLAAVFEGQYPWQIVDGNVDRDAGATIIRRIEADPSIRYLLVTVMPGPQLSRAVP